MLSGRVSVISQPYKIIACDPKLMPTFPQHRNLKGVKNPAAPDNTGATDQTNNLPAISDLVSEPMEANYFSNFKNIDM